MGQLLRIVVLLFGLWLVLRIVKRTLAGPPSDRPSANGAADGTPRMLPCARCGVYVPESDACTRNGKSYCSSEHADADRAR
jgi:uncharacterized protein